MTRISELEAAASARTREPSAAPSAPPLRDGLDTEPLLVHESAASPANRRSVGSSFGASNSVCAVYPIYRLGYMNRLDLYKGMAVCEDLFPKKGQVGPRSSTGPMNEVVSLPKKARSDQDSQNFSFTSHRASRSQRRTRRGRSPCPLPPRGVMTSLPTQQGHGMR